MESEFLKPAEAFVKFLRTSCSCFHVVKNCCEELSSNGFQRLSEKTNWGSMIKPLGKYYLTRNESAVIAFEVGGKYKQGNGFSVVAAHTDSPYLKIKPVSKIESNGYCQIGVETYGGGLWETWLDRDLGLAGRVLYEDNGVIRSKLVNIDESIGIIPSLAIHLREGDAKRGVTINKETMLPPITRLTTPKSSEKTDDSSDSSAPSESPEVLQRHDADLVQFICEHIALPPSSLLDFELFCYDLNEARIAGLHKEFISGRGLDNMACAFAALEGFLSASNLSEEQNIRCMVLFDNEEVGSDSLMGAGSTLLGDVMRTISGSCEEDRVSRRRSMILSCDMAHAVHPSFASVHEANHKPALNKGMVIKTHCKQRYATSSLSTSVIQMICKQKQVPFQQFVLRQDKIGGSTIGPIMSTREGIYTVDVGLPQLSMHSIRETMGTKDVKYGIDFVREFMENYGKMVDNIQLDCLLVCLNPF